MRINVDLTLHGQACMLVPYSAEHVDQYHSWMQDPFLQHTTASEPLALQQERDMQVSWREDEDKCTFIILDTSEPSAAAQQDGSAQPPFQHPQLSQPASQQLQLMAGDVNLFLNDPDERNTAEIEVMVAEPRSRRKGIAREALQLMMAFAISQLGITRFRAKILEDNAPSIALFTTLGYVEVKRVAVFNEVHLEIDVAPGSAAHARLTALPLQYGSYMNQGSKNETVPGL